MEDRQRILEMLQQGKVSVEEATRLLGAVDATEPRSRPRTLRIHVTGSSGDTINLNVPVALARMVLKLLPDHARMMLNEHEVDVHGLLEAITNGGVSGKVVDITSASGEHVEVAIE